MKVWMKLLETLAGKLTAILAFGILLIIVLALVGDRIPEKFLLLVYVVAISVMIIFTIQIFAKNRSPDRQETGEVVPPPSPVSEKFTSRQPLNARDAYLRAIISNYRAFPLDWLESKTAETRLGKVAFESLYVSLDTTTKKKSNSRFQAQA